MNRLLFLTLILAPMALSTGTATAQERTPITETTTITKSGHYVLVENLESHGHTLITIQAESVRIDLNGKMLFNVLDLEAPMIRVLPEARDVSISNGTLKAGGISGPSTPWAGSLRLEDVTIDNPLKSAVYIQPRRLEIRRCRFLKGGTIPVLINDGETSGFITDSEFHGFPGHAISGHHLNQFTIARCTFFGGKGGKHYYAVNLTGTQIEVADNKIHSLDGCGILLCVNSNSRVVRNIVVAEQFGISISGDRVLVAENQVSECHTAITTSINFHNHGLMFDGNLLVDNIRGFHVVNADTPVLRNNVASRDTQHNLGVIIDAGGNIF